MKHIKTFESFVNGVWQGKDGNTPIPSAKAKNLCAKLGKYGWSWFEGADGPDSVLPQGYHTALKTLKIDAGDAIVAFWKSAGLKSLEELADMAKKSGVEYVAVDEEGKFPGEKDIMAGIAFSSK